ncbi:hypothetical protein mRhiFer1_008773 [Rhinolophus ferrumequinum]|uniref:Uncharacterized protein n=1 Tax=Rhinolophus ferrumequinum TaxID=59479 RepID=A0A7J7TMV0_RHIFE|nr:hypothetical protein mRhiFer1_008773 [Rhinolophus ferrumequinum]
MDLTLLITLATFKWHVQWYLGVRTSPLMNISVYKRSKLYGSMVSLDSKIHAKFAVLGVDFKDLERINPSCITFYGETMPRFSNISELEQSSGTDYVSKPRYHCVYITFLVSQSNVNQSRVSR